MNKVITINLNGRAYQLEERGFDALRRYLDTAAAKLAGNPDKDEIMADFEQAIADKFDQKLSPGKNVVLEREIEEIIAAMGPVDGGHNVSEGGGENAAAADEKASESSKTDTANSANQKTESSDGPKRLYRIPQGSWIFGVCNGLAAYFNVDVTLVRVVSVLVALVTHGIWLLGYLVLAFVMPPALTENERARAHGWTTRAEFNAHDFIEEAKKYYAQLQKMHDEHKAEMAAAGGTKEWKRKFKEDMRAKKQQMKQEWREKKREWQQHGHSWKDGYGAGHAFRNDQNYGPRDPQYEISRAVFGFFAVVVSIVLLALGVVWVVMLFTLIKFGTVFGYAIGTGHPLWVSLVFLAAAFYIITIPFRLMLHAAWGRHQYHSGFGEFFRFLVFIAVCAVLVYTARELFPQVYTWWNSTVAWLSMKR